jgi:hypothetical protein
VHSLIDRRAKILPRPTPQAARRRTSWEWERDSQAVSRVGGDEADHVVDDGGSSWKREPSLLRQELRPEDVVLTYEEDPFGFAVGLQLKSVDEEWDRVWNALPAAAADDDDDDDEVAWESSERGTWLDWTEEAKAEEELVEKERRDVGTDDFGRLSLYPSGWNWATEGGKICCL